MANNTKHKKTREHLISWGTPWTFEHTVQKLPHWCRADQRTGIMFQLVSPDLWKFQHLGSGVIWYGCQALAWDEAVMQWGEERDVPAHIVQHTACSSLLMWEVWGKLASAGCWVKSLWMVWPVVTDAESSKISRSWAGCLTGVVDTCSFWRWRCSAAGCGNEVKQRCF